jgi:hypothetical protein
VLFLDLVAMVANVIGLEAGQRAEAFAISPDGELATDYISIELAGSRSTTSAITRSPGRPSWARSA